jgi:CHASE3 domain sensor protein
MPHRLRVSVGGTAVLLVLALFGAVAFASVSRLSKQQAAIGDTNAGINSVQNLLVATYEADRAAGDYVQRGSAISLTSFVDARARIEDALDDLRRRAEDRPRQRAVLDTLGQLIGARVGAMDDAISMKKRQTEPSAITVAHVDSSKETRGGMLPLIQRMREEELVMLAERTRLMSREGRISRMIVLGGSIIAFLVAAVVLVPVRTENA